jgi:hypothetical protein
MPQTACKHASKGGCSRPNCTFNHRLCMFGPKCRDPTKCGFVHYPSTIPCRDGHDCWKEKCVYYHGDRYPDNNGYRPGLALIRPQPNCHLALDVPVPKVVTSLPPCTCKAKYGWCTCIGGFRDDD